MASANWTVLTLEDGISLTCPIPKGQNSLIGKVNQGHIVSMGTGAVSWKIKLLGVIAVVLPPCFVFIL